MIAQANCCFPSTQLGRRDWGNVGILFLPLNKKQILNMNLLFMNVFLLRELLIVDEDVEMRASSLQGGKDLYQQRKSLFELLMKTILSWRSVIILYE